MRPLVVCLLFLAFTLLIGRAADYELARAGDSTRVVTIEGTPRKVFSYGLISMGGRGAESWRYEYVKEKRKTKWLQRRLTARVLEARSLRRALAHDPTVTEALNLAAVVYGHGPTLWRKARCESRLLATAQNRTSSAAGLLQFLDSTWASTPFAGFSVYSPYANALAGGWMHDVGRGGEWVCQ